MTEELKACPFCSCTDIGEVTINPSLKPAARRFKVYCKGCQIRTSDQTTKKSARQQWNRRAMQGQGGEAVATDAFVPGSLADLLFQLGEKGIRVSGGTHGDHWRVSPLYTHPADQMADDLTMVKVSRELLEELRDAANEARNEAERPYRISFFSALVGKADALLNGGRS